MSVEETVICTLHGFRVLGKLLGNVCKTETGLAAVRGDHGISKNWKTACDEQNANRSARTKNIMLRQTSREERICQAR